MNDPLVLYPLGLNVVMIDRSTFGDMHLLQRVEVYNNCDEEFFTYTYHKLNMRYHKTASGGTVSVLARLPCFVPTLTAKVSNRMYMQGLLEKRRHLYSQFINHCSYPVN